MVRSKRGSRMLDRFSPSLCTALLAASLAAGVAAAQRETPLETDPLREEVEVRLVLVDVVVLDRADRTVPDLRLEDFEVIVDGKPLPIDTLDVGCPAGGVDDPIGVPNPKKRQPPAGPRVDRKIVLAFDYLHLAHFHRVEMLDNARRMMRSASVPGEQILVAALNGGLRIEQPFTADRDAVERTLKRMQYDVTLFQPDFRHLTEEPFFTGMQALFAVLETVPGPKAVVLFSNNPGTTSAVEDLGFARLAASASDARCSIYPVHADGLIAEPP